MMDSNHGLRFIADECTTGGFSSCVGQVHEGLASFSMRIVSLLVAYGLTDIATSSPDWRHPQDSTLVVIVNLIGGR